MENAANRVIRPNLRIIFIHSVTVCLCMCMCVCADIVEQRQEKMKIEDCVMVVVVWISMGHWSTSSRAHDQHLTSRFFPEMLAFASRPSCRHSQPIHSNHSSNHSFNHVSSLYLHPISPSPITQIQSNKGRLSIAIIHYRPTLPPTSSWEYIMSERIGSVQNIIHWCRMGHLHIPRRCRNTRTDNVHLQWQCIMCKMVHLHSKPSLHSRTQSIVYERVHEEQSHFMVELGSSPSAHIDVKLIFMILKNERSEDCISFLIYDVGFWFFIFGFLKNYDQKW